MDIVDDMLRYLKEQKKEILIPGDVEISEIELNVVVNRILSWLKLEYKRSAWKSEGRRSAQKSLEINFQYPWCVNLYILVEKEGLFNSMFSIKGREFNFADYVAESDRQIVREKAFKHYNPQIHI